MTTALLCITFYIFGACSAFVYAMVRIPKRRSITMHARRDQHECESRRKYRDAETVEVTPAWERQEVGGIRYEHLGMTGEEV